MTDSGGSIQPYQPKDDEVLTHVSDGGYLVGEVLYPISAEKLADDNELTALLDRINEASR